MYWKKAKSDKENILNNKTDESRKRKNYFVDSASKKQKP